MPPIETRVFRYGLVTHALSISFELAMLWFLVWSFGQDRWRIQFGIGALLFPFFLWNWWGNPHSFTVENGKVTATTAWGRRRTWKVEDLTVSGEARSWWSLARSGSVTVYQRSGKKAFWVSVQLSNFEDFIELLAPGSRGDRGPEFNPKSWWNRDLLDR